MNIQVEVVIGAGKDKPKVIKRADGTYAVVAKLQPAHVPLMRAVWVRTFDDQLPFPKDGKGFLVDLKGKLKKD